MDRGSTSEARARAAKRLWNPTPPLWTGLLLVVPLLMMLVLFVVYPLVRLVFRSLQEGGWSNYLDFFRSKASFRALATTFRDSAVVTVLAVGLGGLLAWSLRAAKSRVKKAFIWSAVLVPFWMGVIVKNYAFTMILGRRGILNDILQALHLVDAPIEILYTRAAVVIGMLYTMLPYAVLPLYASFLAVDQDLISAAEGLGASRSQAIRSIVLPLSLPTLLATTAIVWVISIGFYITPVLLGGARSPFIATLIQNRLFQRFDFPGAATAATLVLLTAIVTLVIAWRLVGGERLRRVLL